MSSMEEMEYRGFRILVEVEGGYNQIITWKVYDLNEGGVLTRQSCSSYGFENPPTYFAFEEAKDWVDSHLKRVQFFLLNMIEKIEDEKKGKI